MVVAVVVLAGVEVALLLQFTPRPNWHWMFAVVTLISGTVVALLYLKISKIETNVSLDHTRNCIQT